MLLHELSSHKVRLLLSVLMLKDAGRNHYAIPGVDPIVSDEPRYFADEGHKALLDQLPRLLRVGNTIVSAHCNVHSSSLPPSHRGRGDQPRQSANVPSVKSCKGRRNFRELRYGEVCRTSLLGTWVNKAGQASSPALSHYT